MLSYKGIFRNPAWKKILNKKGLNFEHKSMVFSSILLCPEFSPVKKCKLVSRKFRIYNGTILCTFNPIRVCACNQHGSWHFFKRFSALIRFHFGMLKTNKWKRKKVQRKMAGRENMRFTSIGKPKITTRNRKSFDNYSPKRRPLETFWSTALQYPEIYRDYSRPCSL